LARSLIRYEASIGYSTCFWHNVRASVALFDRDGWYRRMQDWASQPYPEPLRHSIFAKNHPILRRTHASYRHQIALATSRNDLISVQHRVTALLASYFDILFAINRLPHPGEKRLIATATQLCPLLPVQMEHDIRSLLEATTPENWQFLLTRIDALLDHLDVLLRECETLVQ